MRRLITGAMSVGMASIAGIAALGALYIVVRRGERGTVHAPADAIVVLGAQVKADGTPSAALRGRVRRAVELYDAGYAPVLVVTGGVGASGYSEAATMRALALAAGVPEHAITAELRATRTVESARNVADLAAVCGWRRVIVVSDPFHLTRSAALFAAQGFAVQTAGTQDAYFSRQGRRHYRLREVAALFVQTVNGELPPRAWGMAETHDRAGHGGDATTTLVGDGLEWRRRTMTVEEAYAEPVTRKRRRDRAFLIGLAVGIAVGVVATWLLNRAADGGEAVDDEAVVELQPALASDPVAMTMRLPVVPLGNAGAMSETANAATNGAHGGENAAQPVKQTGAANGEESV